MAQLKNTVVNGNFRVNGFMSVGGDLSVNNFSASSITTTTIKHGSNNLLSFANNTITIGITAYDLYLCSNRQPVWKSVDGDKTLATMQDIQSVGNGTLTIKQNNANKGIFTANQTTNTLISLTDTWVPNTATADGYVLKGEGSPNKAWMTNERGEPGWRDVILTDKDTTYTLSGKLDQPVLNNQYYIITTKLDGSNDSSSSVKMKFSTSGFDVSPLPNNEFQILNTVKNSWRPITGARNTDTLAFNSEFFTTSSSESTFTVSPNTDVLITKAFANTTYLGINDTAKNAENAEDAVNAQNADHALYAEEANTALTADKATLADKAKQATNADTLDGWHIDAVSEEVDAPWIAAFVPEVEGNWSKGTVRAMNSQLFARKTDLENVKLTATGDEMNPVYIDANGKPAKAHSFGGLVEASVANNVLTLIIL